MSMFPARFSITCIHYLEEKRAIDVEFSHLTLKRMLRQPFFPSFFLGNKAFSALELKQLLSFFGKKRFSISQQDGSFKVSAASFSELDEFADTVFKETGFRPIVLQPERQFLLQNNWSYFDCFDFFSESEFVKSNEIMLPAAKLPFFSEPLNETVEQLAVEAPELAEKTVESVSLANLLRLPIASVPSNEFLQAEAFLENLFWATGIGKKKQAIFSQDEKDSFQNMAFSKDLAMVDFSSLWPILLTRQLYNLGTDSIDCNCCRPESLSSSNVLPSSLALAEFLKDGFFFQSCSTRFADAFHQSHQEKETRIRRMQDFCLKSVPLGPFFRNQREAIPLADALSLQNSGDATIVGVKEMHWFCQKKESLVSKEILSIAEKISFVEKSLEKKQHDAAKENGLLGISLLSANSDCLLQESTKNVLSRLLCSLPGHFCNQKSAFFDETVCTAIESVQSNVLASFTKFAAEKQARVIASAESSALLKSSNPFALIKQFSQAQKIPALIHAKGK